MKMETEALTEINLDFYSMIALTTLIASLIAFTTSLLIKSQELNDLSSKAYLGYQRSATK